MKRVALFVTVFLIAYSSSAQLRLIKNINPKPGQGSYPRVLGKFSDGTLFMFADNGIHGYEPFVTDGTYAGTKLVKNIMSGSDRSFNMRGHLIVKDTAYFIADDYTHGLEMWVSDGTNFGTNLLKDIFPGQTDGLLNNYAEMIYYKGHVYFSLRDVTYGHELWKTDGTTNGTIMVRDISPGVSYSNPRSFIVAFGKLYFIASDSDFYNYEWWYTDGTYAGTKKLKEILPGVEGGVMSSWFSEMKLINGLGCFFGRSKRNYSELYATDGDSVWMLKRFSTNTGGGNFSLHRSYIVGNYCYFVAEDDVQGYGIWRTDATANGTTLVRKIVPQDSLDIFEWLGTVNNKLVYSVKKGNNVGLFLWVFDVTTNAGKYIRVHSGIIGGLNNTKSGSYLNAEQLAISNTHNGKIYFSATDSLPRYELWVTDGTEAGTKEIPYKDSTQYLLTNLEWINVVDNKVYVSYSLGQYDYELYVYDIPAGDVDELGKVPSVLKIYPNPNAGKFIVEIAKPYFQNGYLSVTDMLGRTIYDQTIQSGTKHLPVTISNLSSGNYQVSITIDGATSTEIMSVK